jgi:hypothetical protein
MYLQVFNSQYEERWDEGSFFVSNDPYQNVPAAGTEFVFDSNNRFLSGTMTTASGEIPFGAAARFQDRESETTDFSYNLSLQPNDRWNLDFDLQYVESATESLDSTVASGVSLDYLDIDLTGGRPVMQTNETWLGDPSNYYMAFTMDNRTDNEADETALKLDAEYMLDGDFLKSVKFGVRFTQSNSENHDVGYNWQPIYQEWMRWWALDGVAPLPRAEADQLALIDLNDFYRNSGANPGVFYAPAMNLAEEFPQTHLDLHEQAAGNYLCCYGAAATSIRISRTRRRGPRTQWLISKRAMPRFRYREMSVFALLRRTCRRPATSCIRRQSPTLPATWVSTVTRNRGPSRTPTRTYCPA